MWDLTRELLGSEDVTILKGRVARDHLHLFVSTRPQLTISRVCSAAEGKPSYKMLAEFEHLCKRPLGAAR